MCLCPPPFIHTRAYQSPSQNFLSCVPTTSTLPLPLLNRTSHHPLFPNTAPMQFESLPAECLQHVLYFSAPRETAHTLSRVCQWMRKGANEHSLWTFYSRNLPQLPVEGCLSMKQAYSSWWRYGAYVPCVNVPTSDNSRLTMSWTGPYTEGSLLLDGPHDSCTTTRTLSHTRTKTTHARTYSRTPGEPIFQLPYSCETSGFFLKKVDNMQFPKGTCVVSAINP